jgi:hypothetical protein
MRKIQRITESDINRIVKKTTKKNETLKESVMLDIPSLLIAFGILAGYGVVSYSIRKKIIENLRSKGKNELADKMEQKLKRDFSSRSKRQSDDTGGEWGDFDL